METRILEIKSKSNSKIKIGVIPGHFATNHSHVNYYIDMTKIKTHHKVAKETARELAKAYISNLSVDTIICLEGTEIIGAFLARELAKGRTYLYQQRKGYLCNYSGNQCKQSNDFQG